MVKVPKFENFLCTLKNFIEHSSLLVIIQKNYVKINVIKHDLIQGWIKTWPRRSYKNKMRIEINFFLK
jgi:hypothetical protein